MPQKQIVIDIENRIVSVFADDLDLAVILVDFDSEGVDPCSPNMVKVTTGRYTQSAFVVSLPVEPLYQLAGSITEQAIDAAYEQGALRETVGGSPC